MLEMAILGLLKEHDRHGYELKKQLEALFGPFSRFSYGSLYPALARLETAEAVESELGPKVKVPAPVASTGSLAGERAALRARRAQRRPQSIAGRTVRNKKVYSITTKGERLFHELLTADEAATTEDDRSFRLRVAFASYLPAEERKKLFERRKQTLLERIAESRAALAAHSDPFSHALVQHEADSAERDLSWLDELIALTKEA